MRVIVGLGNPGAEYAGVRHNAGVLLVDRLAEELKSNYDWRRHYDALVYKTPDLVLVKTKSVFMNESGRLLRGLLGGELYVAHDDLDIRLGEYKIQKGKGPKEHKGVESVERTLGEKDFWRIRIGIDNREESGRVAGEQYVLEKFTEQEKEVLERTLEKICHEIVEANNRREKAGR